jgi:SAM-dependent methyltransferase
MSHVSDRYWFDNSLSDEAIRLALLQEIADPRSISLFNGLGVGAGWRCAELGAGGGSMARWLADRVGPDGQVVAVDRDVTPCRHLGSLPNVEVVESTLEELDFSEGDFDLIHARNVLMHLDAPEDVIGRVIPLLRRGGIFLFEEADYYPLAGATSEVFARVATPLVGTWTWARTLPSIASRLGADDIEVHVDAPLLQGGSPEAAFWAATFNAVQTRLVQSGATHPDDFQQAISLLADPGFWTPFAAVVCVSGKRRN